MQIVHFTSLLFITEAEIDPGVDGLNHLRLTPKKNSTAPGSRQRHKCCSESSAWRQILTLIYLHRYRNEQLLKLENK